MGTTDLDLKKMYPKLVGVYSRDELNEIPHGACIINLDKHKYGGGTHWISIYRKGNVIFYFDSFGEIAPEKLDKLMCPYIFNNTDIQGLNSSSCGEFCVCFLKHMDKNPTIKAFGDFLNCFSTNYIKNEDVLKSLLSFQSIE